MQKAITKVVFITGSARRIGAEIARTFHQAGMNVVLHYHTSQQAAENLCMTLNEQRPDSAMTLQGDLRKIATLNGLIESAVKAWGRLDVLVNNASQFYPTKISTVTELVWDDLLSSNVKAPFFLSQAAAPSLAKTHGSIVNIADIHGERPMREYSVYCISKAAIIMLTKALAKELGPSVRVNAVSPGETLWPEGENALSDEMKKEILSRTVLRTIGNSTEVAKAVLFLAETGCYMTGHVMVVDGGRSLSM